jgi:flagellar hook-associated protein 1 FlgK
MRATFSGFYIAKKGLDVARAQLEVTGQNITNVSTEGYTRQRVDTYAVGAYSGNMRYSLVNEACIGNGVQIDGTSQLRDPYLDVRYRRENALLGEATAQYNGLADLGYLFDSATEDGFDTQFSDIVTQLQSLSENPSDTVSENLVKTSCSMLLQMFNNYSTQLESLKEQHVTNLQDGSILDANECLSSITQLNQAIKSSYIAGNPSLELNDQRNLLLDQLSQYVNIEVSYNPVDIGGGVTVDELSVNMIAPNGDKFMLIDNEDCRQFEMSENNGTIGIRLVELDGSAVDTSVNGSINLTNGDISDQLSTGSFLGELNYLNGQGAFSDPPSDVRGLPYYEKMLDTVARAFANTMNEANRGADGSEKPLFVSSIEGEDITAGNITIAEAWEESTGSYLTTTKELAAGGSENTDDNSNILYMISLFSQDNEFTTETGYALFSGTFQECVSDISATQGLDKKDVNRQYETHASTISDIDGLRQSISSVNIDEEGINLIMYNQSLTACSRFMTTLDEALDTIISRMGVVGR